MLNRSRDPVRAVPSARVYVPASKLTWLFIAALRPPVPENRAAALEAERAGVGLDRAGVGDARLPTMLVPVPPVLLSVPSLMKVPPCRGAAVARESTASVVKAKLAPGLLSNVAPAARYRP